MYVRSGLAVCLMVVAAGSLRAQEVVSAAPQSTCSGLGCLFSSGSKPAPEAEPASAPTASAPTAPAQTSDKDLPQSVGDDPVVKKADRVVKPVHPVTIAADPADIDRLKGLAAASPKTRLHFVGVSAKDADFTLTTVLGDEPAAARAKLFSVQMHVVAGSTIRSMSDLKDKVVSFGPAGGPTQATARKAFEALAIPVKETPLDYANALDGLSTGDIDAVVMLTPQPSKQLAAIDGAGLHLLAWPDGAAAPNGASLVTIPASIYPRLGEPGSTVRVVGVDAVLNMSAKGAKQHEARSFFDSLGQHSAALSKRGFDLVKSDVADRSGRRVASVEHR